MAISAPLGFKLKANYGVAQMGESLVNGVLGAFLLFYYSQVLGMSPSLAAFGVGTAVIVDAISDPLVGSLSDRSRSSNGRRHPFMYAGAIPTGICMYLLFDPMVSSEMGLLVWMVVFVNLTRTAMTVFHIPHIAMGAELSDDYDERSSIVGYRTFFANVGGLSALILGFGFFFAPTPEFENGQLNPAAYGPFASLVALLLALSVIWTAWSTRHVIPSLPVASPGPRPSLWSAVPNMMRDAVAALRSKSFRWLFLGVLLLFVIIGIDAALSVHMFTFFWEFTRIEIMVLSPAFAVGAMFGILLSPALLRRFGKKAMLQFGLLAWAGLQGLPVILRLVDWLPANGDEVLMPILFSMKVIQGVCTVQSNIAFGSMTADSIDEYELESGARQEGIFFAASSFATKAPVGIGNIIAGIGLELIDWPIGPEIRTAADIAPDKLIQLGLMVGPGVAVCALLCYWCYAQYQLTREGHATILEELRRRRSQQTFQQVE
jgi:GPH family glycoside/pentoside/hexuronide:cation symporter